MSPLVLFLYHGFIQSLKSILHDFDESSKLAFDNFFNVCPSRNKDKCYKVEESTAIEDS